MTGMNPAFVKKVQEQRRLALQQQRRLVERQSRAEAVKRGREQAASLRSLERLAARRARQQAAPPADIRSEFTVITVRSFAPLGMDTLERVARENGMTAAALIGDSKSPSIVAVRHMAIRAVAEKHEEMSTVEIGWLFGGRDHTTIVASLKKTRKPGQKR